MKDHIFELYDDICDQHVSFHKTLESALKAMGEAVVKISPALCRDYEGDTKVSFQLSYTVKSHRVCD